MKNKRPEILQFLRFLRDEVTVYYIQFIPIVEKSHNPSCPISDRSVTGKAYGQFLTAIYDEWVQSDVGKVFIQIFDVALAAWAGYRPGLCVHEATCGRALAMEHNGDLYSCDHFVDSGHFLGNVIEQSLVELINLPQQHQFGRDKKNIYPGWRGWFKCAVRGLLGFFTHVDNPMRCMVELLQAHRAPAEIMEQIRLQRASGVTINPGRKRHKHS